jgi:hypothetical protein
VTEYTGGTDHNVDTTEKVQVADFKFVSLEKFIDDQKMHLVTFDDAKIRGKYTVVVFNDGTVRKCFVSGTALVNSIRMMVANRSELRFSVRRDQVWAVYQ